ncbi:FA core complex associated protein 100, partial [Homo sapiens]
MHLALLSPLPSIKDSISSPNTFRAALARREEQGTDSRSTSQDDRDSEDGDQPSPVIPVDPDACILPDAALCAFTLLDSVLVTLVQGPARWKMQLFEQPCPGEDPRPGGQIGEVELSSYTPPAGVPGKPAAPHFLPVLCSVSPSGSRVPHDLLGGSGGFTLEDALFGLLFGAD